MDSYLKQTGDHRYFDVRLMLGEAIAIIDAVAKCKNLMAQLDINEKDLTNVSQLNMAMEKISRGYMVTIEHKSNEFA